MDDGVEDSPNLTLLSGDAVAVYGATDQTHGTFTVKIDDQASVSLNGSAPSFRPQTLLVRPPSYSCNNAAAYDIRLF